MFSFLIFQLIHIKHSISIWAQTAQFYSDEIVIVSKESQYQESPEKAYFLLVFLQKVYI